jgi:type I restriction enzyme S subunit
MALPLGWTRVYLSDICVPRKEKVLPAESLLRVFIGLEQVQAHTMKLLNTVDSSQIKSSVQKFYMNDILYGRLRPYLNKVIVTDIDGICSSEFIVLPQQQCLDSNYLAYHLNSARFVAFASSKVTGDRPRIDFDAIGDYELLFPPLAEQHRIVAKIDALFSELDKGVEILQTVRKQLRTYRQAVLKWAFECKNREMKPLRTMVETIFDGPFGSNLKTDDYTDSGVRVVRLENLKAMSFFDDKKSYVSTKKYQTLIHNTVKYPDLIMGTFISGEIKVCIMPERIEKAINKADCVCIRTNNPTFSRFLMYYLSSKQTYDNFFAHIHGATRPRVNTTQIKEILIPVVAPNEQTQIIAAIESHLSVCDKLEQIVDENLAKAQALRQSILKRAFAGKLVPQDPNDEPAGKLLERIKAAKATAATRTATARRKRK